MATAKVSRSGNSQTLRLPREFRLDADEVEIYRRGDEIVLRERPRNLAAAFELLCALPDDVLADRGDDTPQAGATKDGPASGEGQDVQPRAAGDAGPRTPRRRTRTR